MATTTPTQRRYDHRLRHLVRATRDIDGAVQRGVPRSTARGWLIEPKAEVVSVDVVDLDALRLQQEVLRLRARVPKMIALFRVLLAVLKCSGYSLKQAGTPGGSQQRALLHTIDRSRAVLTRWATSPANSVIVADSGD